MARLSPGSPGEVCLLAASIESAGTGAVPVPLVVLEPPTWLTWSGGMSVQVSDSSGSQRYVLLPSGVLDTGNKIVERFAILRVILAQGPC